MSDVPVADLPYSAEMADTLKDVDISDVASVRLLDIAGDEVFTSKRAGILRLMAYSTIQLGKTRFAPGELTQVFANVIPHIRSSLPKDQLDTILASIE